MAKPKYRMPRGKLKNLSINELSGVDQPCQAPATVSLMKRAPAAAKVLFARVVKQAVLTDEVDGHQHTLDLDDPADSWCDSYGTSYQTMEGADSGHSHPWTFDPSTGAITIGADSGHTHSVADVVPPDVLAAAAIAELEEKQRRALNAATAILNSDVAGAVSVTVDPLAMRATPTPHLTTVGAPPNVVLTTSEKKMPTEQDTKIADLEKRLATAQRLATLSDAQRAHFAKLAHDEGSTFLAKSFAERDAIVAEIEKANEVVYTSTSTGKVFRKSDVGSGLVDMAKQLDAQAAELAKSRVDAASARLEKRATEELGHLAGEPIAKVAVLRAVDAITDEAIRAKAVEMLKAADAAMKTLGTFNGSGAENTNGAETPVAKFNAARVEFAKAKHKVDKPSDAQVRGVTGEFIRTEEGGELYADAYPTNVPQA